MRIQETARHAAISPRYIRARVHQCVIHAYLERAAHRFTMPFMDTGEPSALPLEQKRAAWGVLHNGSSCARTQGNNQLSLQSNVCTCAARAAPARTSLGLQTRTCRGRPLPARVELHRVGREGGGRRRGPHGRNELRARAAQHPEVPALAAPRQYNLHMDRSLRMVDHQIDARSLAPVANMGPATAPWARPCALCSCGRQLFPSAPGGC